MATNSSGGTQIFDNPLQAKSLTDLLTAVLGIVVQVGLVVIVFFIIYAGFQFVTAGGDTAKVTSAKNTFYATLVGSAIILGSYAIVKALQSTVNQLKAGTGVAQVEDINNFKV